VQPAVRLLLQKAWLGYCHCDKNKHFQGW